MKFLAPVIVDDVIIQFVDIKQFIKDLITKKEAELKELVRLELYESCVIIREKITSLELELAQFL